MFAGLLSKLTNKSADIGAVFVVLAVLIVIMQVASHYVPPFIMPAPAAIYVRIQEILATQYWDMLVTSLRLIAGLGFAMLLGVVLGLVAGMSRIMRPFLRAVVIIDTGIPALSWMLLAVFWFRDPEVRIFFILGVIIVPFYTLNIYEGLRAVPRELVDMIESFRPSRWQTFRFLVWPWVIPYILMTTKSIIGFAIRMAIFAELLASAVGIGAKMGLAQATFQIDGVIAWTCILVLINLLSQAAVAGVEGLLLRWRSEVEVR